MWSGNLNIHKFQLSDVFTITLNEFYVFNISILKMYQCIYIIKYLKNSYYNHYNSYMNIQQLINLF